MTTTAAAWSATRNGETVYYPNGLYVGRSAGYVTKTHAPRSPFVGHVVRPAGEVDLSETFATRAQAKAWVVLTVRRNG